MAEKKKPSKLQIVRDAKPAVTAKQLTETIAKLREQHGKGVLMKLSGKQIDRSIPVIPTGSIQLDYALGVGGYPRGRIVEVYGPEGGGKTTLCLHAIAQAQKAKGVCVFIDAEHALDVRYAKQLDVRVQDLLISQPDYGEQGLEVADALCRSGAVALIVVDSVAALTPKAELDGDMGDTHMGLQARMMSQAMRKLASVAGQTGTTIIFINQIRHKIGVMYGCFHYSTRVTLADGTQEKIGKIVNQKMDVEVMSFDPKTGEVRSQRVVDWHDNGETAEFLAFTCTSNHGGNGRSQFKVTPKHIFFTHGMREVSAETLSVGDFIMGRGDFVFNDDQRVLALSQVLGDGSLRRSGNRVRLRVVHGWKQREYCRWKASIFGDQVGYTETKPGEREGFDLSASCDLHDIQDEPALIAKMGLQGVAIWYLDDGSFSGSYIRWGWGKMEIACKRWSIEQKWEAAARILRLGLPEPTVTKNGFLWSGSRTRICMEKLAPYMPTCMLYKVHPKMRNLCGKHNWDSKLVPRQRLLPAVIKDIRKVPAGRHTHRFDLAVENDHTYMVDGVAVHNSPEVTTGGNALKYYASVRIDVRRATGLIQDSSGKNIGGHAKLKVVKNKVAPPFQECEVDIIWGTGIHAGADVLKMAADLGIVEQSGSWYSFGEKRIGQGWNNAANFLTEHEDTQQEIRAEIALAMGESD